MRRSHNTLRSKRTSAGSSIASLSGSAPTAAHHEECVKAMKALFKTTLAGEETTLAEVPFRITVDDVTREEWWTVHHACLRRENGDDPFLIQFSTNVTEQVKLRTISSGFSEPFPELTV